MTPNLIKHFDNSLCDCNVDDVEKSTNHVKHCQESDVKKSRFVRCLFCFNINDYAQDEDREVEEKA